MSDSEKLRRKQGNIWIALSFSIFAFIICLIWLTFLSSLLIFLMGGGLILIFIVYFCIDFANNAYKTYVGVNNEEINKSDSAKLRKVNGICKLVGAYVFLALAISSIWVFFVFAKDTLFLAILVVLFCVFLGGFFGNVIVAVNDFMAIEKFVEK